MYIIVIYSSSVKNTLQLSYLIRLIKTFISHHFYLSPNIVYQSNKNLQLEMSKDTVRLITRWAEKLKGALEEIIQEGKAFSGDFNQFEQSSSQNGSAAKQKSTGKKSRKQKPPYHLNSYQIEKELEKEGRKNGSKRSLGATDLRRSNYSYGQRLKKLRQLRIRDQQLLNRQAQQNAEKEKRKPISAFFAFLRENKEQYQSRYPQLSSTELTNLLGEVWKKMQDHQKKSYHNETKANKMEFDKKFMKFVDAIMKLQKHKLHEQNQGQNSDKNKQQNEEGTD